MQSEPSPKVIMQDPVAATPAAGEEEVDVVADTRRLPGPNADIWDWQLHGACRGMDSAFFFHPDGERGPSRANREARAKAVCQRCPVLVQCRQHALAVQEPYGIWGGLSEAEREVIIKKRQRNLVAV
jgi:WhiB family redox-sensing transcriptional regulator